MTHDSQVLMISLERAGKIASYEVHAGHALIGSGSHCDVRLLPEDAAPEQLRLELRGGEIYVHALAAGSGKLDGGVLPRTALLLPSSRLQLGQSELQVRTTASLDRAQRSKRQDGWPPAVRAAGLALIAAGLYFAIQDEPAPSALDRSLEQPPLFGAPIRECPARGDDSPDFHAGRLGRDAHLRGERAPFFPREGVVAVTRYEEAAACFKQLGVQIEAQAAERNAAALRHELADEFHLRHVRLERLLSVKKYDAAQRELQVLRDFVSRNDGPYAQWLSAVQREINARFAGRPRKG